LTDVVLHDVHVVDKSNKVELFYIVIFIL